MMTAERADTDEAIADVESQLSMLFSRVQAGWKDSAARVHPELQPVGYKILVTLAHTGAAHAGAIGEMLHTDKSVMSRQLRSMEALGLVSSHTDAADGRLRVIEATPLALEKIATIRTSNRERLRDILRTWDADDVEKFAELLGRLTF
ncbi:MarR family winged helix-turn-helix transcriptional regulator [Glaciibacter flavus]|uniref:MarR family winged helix-turn-helix transcriptional regulator n=1 Tax=Orlajensenia flava TaxID=2565934 RepID=UPI003B00A2B6